MFKYIIKLMCMSLIICIVFLILNEFYVIDFSNTTKGIFIFITLSFILLTSLNEALLGINKFTKIINSLNLICALFGGVLSIYKGELNPLIYLCLILSLTNSAIVLTYSKA